MTLAQTFTIFFTPLIQSISFFIITLIGTMLGSVIVTSGDGWGKIAGSNEFQSKNKVLIFFVGWAIGITMALNYFSPMLETEFSKYTAYFPVIIFQFAIIFYLWFNHDFHYKQKWLKFGIMEFIVFALGYAVVSGI
ncbi:MAG TPA: hypothetical protein VEU72_03350 [Nitrosopumilaceae archaeon]|nr:hypothetical protein [Nitrosopumilaceae archaeon]